MKLTSIMIMTILLLTVSGQKSLAVLINFDDVPNGTIIDTQYTALGVTFDCVVCASDHAFARTSVAASPPNVVTLVAPFDPSNPNSSVLTLFGASMGAVTAAFSTPQKSVSIDAAAIPPAEFLTTPLNKPFLEAYSDTAQLPANFLGSVLYPLNFGDSGYGGYQTLSFTSPTNNILSVRFSSQLSQPGPAVFGNFDNLNFTTGVIPEPATILLLGSGLIGLATWRWHRKA